jgi:hypothetical protein
VVLRFEGSYLTIKGGSLQIRGGSDDTIIIFGVTGSGVFGRGIQHNLYENITKFDRFTEFELLEFKVLVICLATGCVS